MINTEEKGKRSIIELIKGMNWNGIILCVLSFFVGRVCMFDCFYTIGIAYVGAMFYEKQLRRWSSLLCILGILSNGMINVDSIKYVTVLLVITALREVMNIFKCHFNLRNQMVIASISLGIVGMMNLFFIEISLYKIIVCLLEIVVVMGMMNVLNMAIEAIQQGKKSILVEHQLASVAFLMAIFLCGMIDFYIMVPVIERIYIKDIFVFCVMIAITYMGGASSGVITAAIISTVLVVIGYMPAGFVGIYIFAVLIGGLFSYLERVGIVFAMTLGLLLGFALFNNRIIDWHIFAAYGCGAILSLIVPRNYFGIANWFGYAMEVDEAHHLLHVQAVITDKLKKFAAAFECLGKEFEHIPLKNMDLDIKQMNEIIEDAGESLCKDCAMCQFCWKDYIKDTYRYSYEMLEVLEKKGQIQIGDIPMKFRKACINAESFAYALSLKMDMYKQSCRWQKRFEEARGLIAEEFKGISSSVGKLSETIEKDFCFNKEEERKIKEALQTYGIRTRDVMVLESNGKRQEIHLYCQYKGEVDFRERVIEATEKALEAKLETSRYEYNEEGKYCFFEMKIKKQFAVTVSAYNKAKDDVCGDAYSFMELDEGNYLIAVADGMGSGSVAHKESETTIELLESFLETGFESEVALKMINSALVLKSNIECYTTMDMALIDQHTGVIEFLKMGASTSFIVRGQEITTVRASSLPIGILSHIDLVSCKKQLKDGDIVIMITDGILENQNDLLESETTFKHFILEAQSSSPEYLAKFLLNKSKNLLAGKEGDDMTVVVARIWKQ